MLSFDSYTTADSEVLLRTAQARFEEQRKSRRVLSTEVAASCVFLACAGALAWLAPESRQLTPIALLVSAVAFLVAYRMVFPVASGWTRPTELVFVPMLFVLPTGLVPLLIAALLLLDLLPAALRGQAPPTLVFARLADAFYSLGPALVIVLFGAERFSLSNGAVYALAFGAQVVFDLGWAFARGWFAERIRPSKQRQLVWLYVTDACLGATGLLIAAAVVPDPGALLLVIPLIALLGLFARERQERMDGALELSTAYRGTAQLLGDVIEDDDQYTGMHSRDVVHLSVVVADHLGLDATAQRNVEFGALLHDVGKIRVPNEIIRKPGKLDDAEWAVMKMHTIYGEEMLNRVGGALSTAASVVRASHERFDGTGYPDRLAGDQIPIAARIVSACDAFSAMTTTRSYRKAMSQGAAIDELRRCSGTHFDPDVVEALIAVLEGEPASTATRPDCSPQATDVHLYAEASSALP